MPQEIYNEGRVVGLSAWEIFMREALGNGVPQSEIPDEHKWLASMIGSGASMILRIPANTSAGVYDYALPANSNLSASGVIVANPFLGDCEWDSSTWATKVISYSPLIQNTSESHPTSSSVPYDANYTPEEYKNSVSEFVKITDGIVFTQNATWLPTESGSPNEDIDPNFNESSTVVRLCISADIDYDVKILLTGFHNKRILQGLSGFATPEGSYCIGGSTDIYHNEWPDGGMLGPEITPWASKIVFSVPSSTYVLLNQLTRTLPLGGSAAKTVGGITFNAANTTVKTNSLVDFAAINLTDYYTAHNINLQVQENVSSLSLGINDSYSTLVAWYPNFTASQIASATDNSKIFPPALYAAKVTATGNQTLVPLDVAAPGTVKGFKDSTVAYNYTQQLPDNFAVYYNNTTKMFSFVIPGEQDSTKWAGTAKLTYLSGNYPKAELVVGSITSQIISLTNASGVPYGNNGVLDGSGGTVASSGPRTLIWDDILKSLKANQQVNILGTKLTAFANELNTSNTIGITNPTDQVGTKSLRLTNSSGNYPVTMTTSYANGANLATLGSGTSIKSGTNFIEFSNGLRLYISGTNPGTSNVPVGSIGIGWVNS